MLDAIELKIRKFTKEKGWTIKFLCEKVEITQAGLTYIFKEQSLKVDLLLKIADVLDVDVREFFITDPDEAFRIFSHQTGQGNVNQQGIKNKMGADKTSILQQENAHLKDTIELQKQLIEALRK